MSSFSQWRNTIRTHGGHLTPEGAPAKPPDLALFRLDWSQFHWHTALRRLPAIVLLLAAGAYTGEAAPGVLAAGAALSVGFGAARQMFGSRLLAMLVTTGFMALSATAGTFLGGHFSAVVVATMVFGFGCGLITLVSEDIGWIAMQGVIAFLVASGFPSDWKYALGRSSFILLGGAVQIICMLLIWRVEGIGRFGPESTSSRVKPEQRPRFPDFCDSVRQSAAFSSAAFGYGLRVGITLGLAVAIDHLLKLRNGYWLSMTTLIVLKPDFYRTYTGGLQRTIGTLAGVIAASLIAHLFQPQNYVLIGLVGGLGFCTYAFQKVNPVIFSAALTSFVVFLIAVTGLPEASVTWHRFINTALGCALALTSHSVGFFLLQPWLGGRQGPVRN